MNEYSDAKSSAAIEKCGQIAEKIHRLFDELERGRDIRDRLSIKIEPILGVGGCLKAQESDNKPQLCDLALRIDAAVVALASINDDYSDMASRVEL